MNWRRCIMAALIAFVAVLSVAAVAEEENELSLIHI